MDYKIVVAMPHRGTMSAATGMALALGFDQLPFAKIIVYAEGGTIATARNSLVETALQENGSHLFFLDSDIAFPPPAMKHLIDFNHDIVGATYNERHLPPTTTVKLLGQLSGVTYATLPTEPFKAAGLGMGFTLIKMDVFKKLKKPWFSFSENEQGEFVGEDVNFCNKARKAGYDVWCDPRIEIKHIGQYAY